MARVYPSPSPYATRRQVPAKGRVNAYNQDSIAQPDAEAV